MTLSEADLILSRDLSALEAVALALSYGDAPVRPMSESDWHAIALLSAPLLQQHPVREMLSHACKCMSMQNEKSRVCFYRKAGKSCRTMQSYAGSKS